MKKIKNYRALEKLVRGFANHRRIQILELLEKNPELSVVGVAERLDINFKTASEHLRRLEIAGLVSKRSQANNVCHRLTSKGISILKFLRTLE